MAKKKESKPLELGFPKLTRADMDYIARVLSYCLSDQYGEEIVFRFVPKDKGELAAAQ